MLPVRFRYVSAISAKAALIHHFPGLYYEHDDLYWSAAVVMFRLAPLYTYNVCRKEYVHYADSVIFCMQSIPQ